MWHGRAPSSPVLGGAEEAVAGVAEAGDDVRLVVEPLVDRRPSTTCATEPRGVEARHALGRGQHAHRGERAGVALG